MSTHTWLVELVFKVDPTEVLNREYLDRPMYDRQIDQMLKEFEGQGFTPGRESDGRISLDMVFTVNTRHVDSPLAEPAYVGDLALRAVTAGLARLKARITEITTMNIETWESARERMNRTGRR